MFSRSFHCRTCSRCMCPVVQCSGYPLASSLSLSHVSMYSAKESHLRVGKMVDLMNVEESVAFLEGHDDFRRAPRTGESALGVGVMAVVDMLVV